MSYEPQQFHHACKSGRVLAITVQRRQNDSPIIEGVDCSDLTAEEDAEYKAWRGVTVEQVMKSLTLSEMKATADQLAEKMRSAQSKRL